MAATKRQLAIRLLQKLEVVGDGQTASDSDIEIAERGLDGVHALLLAERKLKWTWADVPVYAEFPYVMLGAFLSAQDFGKPADTGMWQVGMTLLNRANTAPVADAPTSAEYF